VWLRILVPLSNVFFSLIFTHLFIRLFQYSLVMPPGLIISDIKDVFAESLQILETAQEEVILLIPSSMLPVFMSYGCAQKTKTFIQNGGVLRGITNISHANLEVARARLSIGEDLRHTDRHHEFFLIVGDRHYSISSLDTGIEEFTLDTSVNSFWSENPTYAEYLRASFENAWSHAIPAEERIQELEQERH